MGSVWRMVCRALLSIFVLISLLGDSLARKPDFKRGKPNIVWNDAIIRVNFAENVPHQVLRNKRSRSFYDYNNYIAFYNPEDVEYFYPFLPRMILRNFV